MPEKPTAKYRRGKWTDEQLVDAVASSNAIRQVALKLGLKGSNAKILRRIKELGLDTAGYPVQSRPIFYTEESLREVVPKCRTLSDVARAYGRPPTGSIIAHIKRQIIKFGISTNHFKTTTSGIAPASKKRPEDIFRILPKGSNRTSGEMLRRALTESGVPYACDKCGNRGIWLHDPLTLHVDHVDGNWLNDLRENLRFLCPNCHTQTETWCIRNSEKYKSRLVTSDS